ncbi:DUF4097 family beta strand repeat-containing protein [Adhaeribacter aquaticus]|uniref:DUF4097 family beta strand repeat-containing protein n=1 Tax=Adhaeribacter aquaticus TaxID=299567 RepID=UPI0004280D28|nr:DUF4097 family beta strand repeat-containing protein [Adhaeribacter aquaticus]
MKKFALTFLLLITLLFGALLSFAQDEQKPYLVKEFNLGSNGKLITKTSGGSIKVTGTKSDMAKITMYIRPSNWRNRNDAPSKELLAKYTFDIRKEGNTLYAVAERKEKSWIWDDESLSVSFEIEVPQQTTTNLHTSGGSISLGNVTGTQEVKTSGGSLTFKNIKGKIVAHTSGGSIRVNQYNGNLDAHTSGGSINLDEATGILKAHTSGGSIHLKSVSGDIEAHTSGGSIHADVERLGKFLTLTTSGGSVHATVPGGKGLDLDLAGNSVKTQLSNFTGSSEKNRVKGSINGGGTPVKLSTSGGTTELSYRM